MSPEEKLQEKLDEIKRTSKTQIARKITTMVIRHCVSAVCATTAKKYVPVENKKQQLQVSIGAYAIGGMVADRAVDWAGAKFDEIVDSVKSLSKKLDELAENSEAPKDADEPSA